MTGVILIVLCVAGVVVPVWNTLFLKEHTRTRNRATGEVTPHSQGGIRHVTRLYGVGGAYQDAVLQWRSQPVGLSGLTSVSRAARVHTRSSSGAPA